LVLEQRREGGRAFYHHLSDGEIQLARTEFDSAWRHAVAGRCPRRQRHARQAAPHLEALEAIAARRPVAHASRSSTQFDTLFPPDRPPLVATAEPKVVARLVDVLEAIADAAPLAPVEQRASEAVDLLSHLVGLYELTLTRYLELLGEASVHGAVHRVRLVCRPFE
jgi:hypothetical protein